MVGNNVALCCLYGCPYWGGEKEKDTVGNGIMCLTRGVADICLFFGFFFGYGLEGRGSGEVWLVSSWESEWRERRVMSEIESIL